MYPHYGQSNAERSGSKNAHERSAAEGSAKRANACRLARLSPRLTRQAHSRLIAEPKPSSRAVSKFTSEQPVDVVGGDGGQRQVPGQVHVAHRVQAEVVPVHAAVALEQEPVEGLVV